ncbi:MAG: phosphatidylglycerophosphatase A [Cyclobacteriaceae bacterium]|jgi:phosphatidylglycerophosphatase A|nr:phosphatidylglycerophosphatase A [Cyclobacteriaceae bacterium]
MSIHKLVSSVLGIGYLKGGGTWAALVWCVGWYALGVDGFGVGALVTTLLIFVVGVWSANVVEADWGKDSSKVVIDEVAGMAISLLFLPFALRYIAMAFVLFRFFDIVKPFYIKRAEKFPGGWGVMIDDVIAGICANGVVQGALALKLI